MTCATCARLRAEWYATATPLKMLDEKAARIIDSDRRKPEYRQALAKYREHRRTHVDTGQRIEDTAEG